MGSRLILKPDGVMVGRGAVGKPWIFKLMREHILDGVESVTPSAELIYSVVLGASKPDG